MRRTFLLTRFASLFAAFVSSALAAPPTALAPTPPMGWNSWNWHGKKDITEAVVRETIDAIVSTGMRDAGYNYVVVDGGWRDTKLGPKGELLPHPVKFPHGIKALADHAHRQGLKFGVHVVPGTHDCGGDAIGGFGREEVHLKQFVEWGLDFIKIDKCKKDGGWAEPMVEAVYRKWSGLLANCGRDILFNISAYTFREWNPQVCHMSRTTQDITCRISPGGKALFDDGKPHEPVGHQSVMTIADENNRFAAWAGRGYWNDPDMMVTGGHGLTHEEEKAHFALWCIMSAPLFLGNDPRHMTAQEKEIVLNREAIAIDQDPTEQGRRIRQDGQLEVWAKKLRDGRIAVLLLNRDAQRSGKIALQAGEVGLPASFGARDVWAMKDLGTQQKTVTREIPARSGAFLLLSPAASAQR
jgi:alpha-galactosidase